MIKYAGISEEDYERTIFKRMQGYLQEEYEKYLKTLDEDAYRGLRVNTAKLSVDQFHDLKVCASQPSSSVRSPFIYQRI